MPGTAKKLSKKISCADYLSWPEGETFEIIEGIPYDMSPAPASKHQTISGELFGNI